MPEAVGTGQRVNQIWSSSAWTSCSDKVATAVMGSSIGVGKSMPSAIAAPVPRAAGPVLQGLQASHRDSGRLNCWSASSIARGLLLVEQPPPVALLLQQQSPSTQRPAPLVQP